MKSKPLIYRASFCFIVMPSSVVLVCGLGVFFWSNYVMVYLLEYSLNNNNEIKDTTDMIKSGNFLTLSLWRREQKMFAFKNCFDSNKMCFRGTNIVPTRKFYISSKTRSKWKKKMLHIELERFP